ncbi:MAG: flagellar basal body-associated FliL family protein [Proteobacteria bacterium]|nr:flagellar basal body-associated FliL family protein [Pseudomonadota bacterium]MBU1737655.1 flagellar basal body-associated FliL family protein [Pseudomonadota bacterium]
MADEKEAQGAEAEATPRKKSKAMLFILIGVGILMLGGGGFFAYTKFLAQKPAPVPENQIESVQPEVIGAIYKLSAFTVNLADPKGKRYLKLQVELELENELAVELATKAEPKLRDMVIMLLTSLTFEDVMTPEGKIRIRDELLDRFNRIMRPEKVKNIYFTEFVVQ